MNWFDKPDYKNKGEFADELIGKMIVEWDEDHLKLDDGTVVTIEMTENDCCVAAWGRFSDVELEAVITDVRFCEPVGHEFEGWDETHTTQEVVFIHNLNEVGKANLYADNGNGDFYYSVVAFKIKDIYYAPLGSLYGFSYED